MIDLSERARATADAFALEAARRGDIIAASWAEFLRQTSGREAGGESPFSPSDVDLMRLAFYAGAGIVVTRILGQAAAGEEDDADDDFDKLLEEVLRWSMLFVTRLGYVPPGTPVRQ